MKVKEETLPGWVDSGRHDEGRLFPSPVLFIFELTEWNVPLLFVVHGQPNRLRRHILIGNSERKCLFRKSRHDKERLLPRIGGIPVIPYDFPIEQVSLPPYGIRAKAQVGRQGMEEGRGTACCPVFHIDIDSFFHPQPNPQRGRKSLRKGLVAQDAPADVSLPASLTSMIHHALVY